MNVNSDLIQAYSSARYVICSDPLITLRVNEVSVELANLMITKAFCKAAFITAFNPFREILSADENDLRHKLLVEKINRLGLAAYDGFGSDESGEWPAEKSLLILDIKMSEAIKLVKDFGQNAILWIEEDAIPRLIITA